jgi:urea transporter
MKKLQQSGVTLLRFVELHDVALEYHLVGMNRVRKAAENMLLAFKLKPAPWLIACLQVAVTLNKALNQRVEVVRRFKCHLSTVLFGWLERSSAGYDEASCA